VIAGSSARVLVVMGAVAVAIALAWPAVSGWTRARSRLSAHEPEPPS
jgi:hypothetical protein